MGLNGFIYWGEGGLRGYLRGARATSAGITVPRHARYLFSAVRFVLVGNLLNCASGQALI